MGKVFGVVALKGGESLRENACAKETLRYRTLTLKKRFARDEGFDWLGGLGGFSYG